MYYNKIDVSEGIDVNKANESKKCDICIGIFWVMVLGFKPMSAMVAMTY